MRKVILVCLFKIAKALLSLRYRIRVEGLEKIPSRGVLFLPNHPAEIDPVILTTILGPRFFPRSLVVEHFYYLYGFTWLMRWVCAFPIPSMSEKKSRWRQKAVEKAYQEVKDSLHRGENWIVYPSGKLKQTGEEQIGGASFSHDLLLDCPEVTFVLVRTTGLWGSRFSKALTGSSPDFGEQLKKSIRVIFKNGLFFTPKRKVSIECSLLPSGFPKEAGRLGWNRALEEWYNQRGPEPITLVSYSRWRTELPQVQDTNSYQEEEKEHWEPPQEILDVVYPYLTKLSGNSKLSFKMHLSKDLGLDSLDVADLYVFLDKQYEGIKVDPGQLHTVRDVIEAAMGKKTVEEDSDSIKKVAWPQEGERKELHYPEANSLTDAFLLACDRMGSFCACADAVAGPVSYRKFKQSALILSEQFKKCPGDFVGVMLPSSVAAYLAIFALWLAGKVPVMVNWTSGVKALDHVCKVASLQAVITSQRFLDRLEIEDLGAIEEKFLFLEEVKREIGIQSKIKGVFLGMYPALQLQKKLGLSIDASSVAVLLFTSGTETLPKAVPLSHRNLLENQKAVFSAAQLKKEDILYGVLPPFHSFGFSMTGILPILCGLKVYYAPDPTDARGMAKDIDQLKLTLLCCAPSFLRGLFAVAKPEQLQSVRLIVSGAEKASKELFDYVEMHCKGAAMIEGYGITECSPVVTLHRIDEEKIGVGRALPGEELCIVDTAGRVLTRGEEGEVCIYGPNVFTGYYQYPKDPFIEIGGKRWYRSGDRGILDAQGNLILKDRIHRFVKIGGEMVPLGGIEEELLYAAKEEMWYPLSQESPPLAIVAREKNTEKPEIVLFATFSITKEKANATLRESGWGRLVKIADVKKVEEIPLTGTGKIHYRILEEQLG